MKRILAICALVTALGGAFGVLATLDGRYAKASVVHRVEEDLRRHKIEVRMKYLQERMWDMQKYWGAEFKEAHGRRYETLEELLEFMPTESEKTYLGLQEEFQSLEKELDRLDKEG